MRVRKNSSVGKRTSRAVAFLLSLASLLHLQLCNVEASESDTRSKDEQGRIIVQAAGASFPKTLYYDATYAYSLKEPNVIVSYTSTGSGKGKCRIKDWNETCSSSDHIIPRYIDFAGSDSLLKDAEYAAYPDLQMYPAVAGAVVPIYNILGVDDLVLTTDIVAKIFRHCVYNASDTSSECLAGSITSWSDPAIIALNPLYDDALRAAGDIEVVVREDKSGTTEIWKKSLASFEDAFATQIGTSSKSVWNGATVSKLDTNTGVASYVAHTKSTIGYSVLGTAVELDLNMAGIKKGGNIVRATASSVEFAILEKGLAFGQNGDAVERMTADVHDAKGIFAWPMTGYTYFVLRKQSLRKGATCENRKATINYLNWFYTSSTVAKIAAQYGFASLPEKVAEHVLSLLRSEVVCDVGYSTPLYNSKTQANEVSMVGAGALATIMGTVGSSYEEKRDVTASVQYLSSSTFQSAHLHENDLSLFISGDAAVNEDTVTRTPVLGIPMVAVYSLCGSQQDGCPYESSISLTASTIARILNGDVVKWNDQAIAAENPGANLPDDTIKIAGYSDGSGVGRDKWMDAFLT